MRRKRNYYQTKLIMMLVLAGIVVISIFAGVIKEKGRTKSDDTEIAESGDDETPDSLQASLTDIDTPDEEVRVQITSLVRRYRAACASADIDTIAQIYNTTNLRNKNTFMVMATIITGYQNTECYIRSGLDDASRVVFIYDDLKLADFDTLVPNISYIYVRAAANGEFYIDPGTYNEETMSYEYDRNILRLIDHLENDTEISELVQTVNEKFAQACEGSSSLKTYIDTLTGAVDVKETNAEKETQNDSAADTADERQESDTNQGEDMPESGDATADSDN